MKNLFNEEAIKFALELSPEGLAPELINSQFKNQIKIGAEIVQADGHAFVMFQPDRRVPNWLKGYFRGAGHTLAPVPIGSFAALAS